MKKGAIAPSRYEQLSDKERKNIRLPRAELILSGGLRSFSGPAENRPYFEAALNVVKEASSDFAEAKLFIDAFVLVCNTAGISSKRGYGSVANNLKQGLLKFAKAKGLHAQVLKLWPPTVGADFALWLEDAPSLLGKAYSENSARKFFGEAKRLLGCLSERPEYAGQIAHFEPFPENAFSGAHFSTESYRAQGLSVFIRLLIEARSDFLETMNRFRRAQELFRGTKVERDYTARGMAQWKSIDAVLWELHEQYGGKQLPSFTPGGSAAPNDGRPARVGQWPESLEEANPNLRHAITRYHGGWRKIAPYFQPTAEAIVAPMILMYIYTWANTEPLRAMRVEDFADVKFIGNPRFVIRINKERGEPYMRSFPIDDTDPAAPHKVLRFVQDWTANIRTYAEGYENRLFIFSSNWGEIRGFNTALVNGRSGDTIWNQSLRTVLTRYQLPTMNVSELRQTVIDFGWQLSDKDIRQILAMKGGSSEDVARLHYLSDAFKLRAQQEIATQQEIRLRQIKRNHNIHHRGAARSQDLGAATPGCGCLDPFDSPIPGEKRGTLCGAFGQCPNCPLGYPVPESAYSLARLLQLREELKRASVYLRPERWLRVFAPVKAKLEDWLKEFSAELWLEARTLTLPPIGELE